ncbi:MAG: putative bifunctional diguanylate cyclase/phosphodiesterase [Burkholderiales bacterium]
MKLRLPRSLHMRIMLSIALLQLVMVGAFSVFWVMEQVGDALADRQVVVHKILSLTAPSVEHAISQQDTIELTRYLNRVLSDPLIGGIIVKDAGGKTLFEKMKPAEAPHPVVSWFRLARLKEGIATQLWRDGKPGGVMTLYLSNGPINRDIRNLLGNVAYLLFILLALDLIAIQVLIKLFVSPLGPLTVMAREFTRGNLDTTIAPAEGASDEVRHLTAAFVQSAKVMRQQIEDLERTRGQLASNELRLRNLVNNMREVLVELDHSGKILFLNPSWEKLTGYAVAHCMNKPFSQFLVQPQHQAHFVFGRLEQLHTYDMQIEVRAQDGHSVWLRMSTTLQYTSTGEFTGIVSTLEDVSENLKLQALQREHEQDLYRLTITDPLTGVFNRRHFDEMLVNMMAMNLPRGRQLALLIIDIDGFKFINDTYGHPVGDEVLRTVANKLNAVSQGGIVARLAGDEFAVILQNVTEEEAQLAARHIHHELSGIVIHLAVGELRIQTSIGVALAPAFGKTPQDLVRAADVALYHAKKSGRNRVDTLSKDMGEAIMDIFTQGFELRNALNNGMIAPFLQPIFDLRKNEVMAYEVLTRLKRGNDYVPADEFVLIAEDLGLIREMDLFIINKALLSVPKGVHLFVNISMSSFFAPEFRDEFSALLQSPQAQGRSITIEFTERQTTDMTAGFFKQLDKLRTGGCKIALDDFGAGYSTYSYLRQLKPDFVKIDGSFVQQILTSPQDTKIVEHIRELSALFGAKSIAEHVEDAKTVEVLTRIGVDFAQGYYYGKPKMIEEYVRAGATA